MTQLNKMAMAGAIFFLLFTIGCGENNNGSNGDFPNRVYTGSLGRVAPTGMFLDLVSVSPWDWGAETDDIDIYSHICEEGTTTKPPVYEIQKDARMDVVLEYNPRSCLEYRCPYYYTILSYTVEFTSTDPNAVPLDPVIGIKQASFGMSEKQTFDGLTFMPLYCKWQYLERGGLPWLEVQYEVKVTFQMVTDLGEEMETSSTTYVLLADWDHCGG